MPAISNDDYQPAPKNFLEEFRKVSSEDSEDNPRTLRYAKNLRSANIPPDDLKQNPGQLTPEEVKYIESRRIWTDVVSETYANNQKISGGRNLKDEVINKLKNLEFKTDTEQLYEKCISVLNQSALTISFNAALIGKVGFHSFQVLNVWESANKDPIYVSTRESWEKRFFSFLSPRLKPLFVENTIARPRYGALRLIDGKNNLGPTPMYGKSWVVLKDVAKLNALFVPHDSLGFYFSEESGIPCTVHHLEFILLGCSDQRLKDIANRALSGLFDVNFNQNTSDRDNGYIEALLPAIDLFNPALVEQIVINTEEFTPDEKSIDALQKKGIKLSVFNESACKDPIYFQLTSTLVNAIETEDTEKIEKIKSLLKEYPSLIHMSDVFGNPPWVIAQKLKKTKALDALIQYAPDKFAILQDAIQKDNPELCELVLKADPSLLNRRALIKRASDKLSVPNTLSMLKGARQGGNHTDSVDDNISHPCFNM